jgi:hypothetical protein
LLAALTAAPFANRTQRTKERRKNKQYKQVRNDMTYEVLMFLWYSDRFSPRCTSFFLSEFSSPLFFACCLSSAVLLWPLAASERSDRQAV